jgi:TPR repeat protein
MNGYRGPTETIDIRRERTPRFAPPWSFTMFHALARLAACRAAHHGARLAVLAALSGTVWAAAPLPPAVQNELDRAVIAHESGQLPAAQKAFEALARRGVPAAQYNLAVMHLQGEVPKPDRTLARRLLQRAAEGGFVTAQFMLAQALENGELGPRDLPLAHRWSEVAAEAGSTEAQVAMGTGHYLGRGLPKDPARAVHWFREAAKGGDVGAMYLLASMYEQGDGVERDLRLARYWYGVAAQNGDRAAPGKLREIDALLGSQPS